MNIDVQDLRTWVIFYLICSVAILVAATFIVLGITTFFWISSTLIIVVIGFNFILLFTAIKENAIKIDKIRLISLNDETE